MKRRFSLSLVVLLLLSILFTGCDMVSVVGANPNYRIAGTVKDKNGGFGAVGQALAAWRKASVSGRSLALACITFSQTTSFSSSVQARPAVRGFWAGAF